VGHFLAMWWAHLTARASFQRNLDPHGFVLTKIDYICTPPPLGRLHNGAVEKNEIHNSDLKNGRI
jgi:hypothetical protein